MDMLVFREQASNASSPRYEFNAVDFARKESPPPLVPSISTHNPPTGNPRSFSPTLRTERRNNSAFLDGDPTSWEVNSNTGFLSFLYLFLSGRTKVFRDACFSLVLPSLRPWIPIWRIKLWRRSPLPLVIFFPNKQIYEQVPAHAPADWSALMTEEPSAQHIPSPRIFPPLIDSRGEGVNSDHPPGRLPTAYTAPTSPTSNLLRWLAFPQVFHAFVWILLSFMDRS